MQGNKRVLGAYHGDPLSDNCRGPERGARDAHGDPHPVQASEFRGSRCSGEGLAGFALGFVAGSARSPRLDNPVRTEPRDTPCRAGSCGVMCRALPRAPAAEPVGQPPQRLSGPSPAPSGPSPLAVALPAQPVYFPTATALRGGTEPGHECSGRRAAPLSPRLLWAWSRMG